MTSVGATDHTLYYGNKVRGSVITPFARCTCGALLEGQEAIDGHRLLKGAALTLGPNKPKRVKKTGSR